MDAGDGWHDLFFADANLHADAVVQIHRQEVIDDAESSFVTRIVDRRDVDQRRETALFVGLEELHQRGNVRCGRFQRQLAQRDRMRRYQIGLPQLDMRGQFFQLVNLNLSFHQRTKVPVRRIFRCSCNKP